MPKGRLHLFRILGFEVRLDPSWFVIALLIAWSLAVGYFPAHVEDLPSRLYWAMGVAGALGLFFSIVFHELSHSLVARRFGIPMRGITLFIFGGVAEMGDEPPSPRSEFWMAIVGPAASLCLAAFCLGIFALASSLGAPAPFVAVTAYLGWINLVLAVFNLLPAFPLDGGRILRSLLWRWRGNLHWATNIASQAGAGFGLALMLLGVLSLLAGGFVGGLWWLLIGLFLRNAARMSYRQLLVRDALSGASVREFMTSNPVHVPRNITVEQFVQDYVLHFHHKMFPVMEDDRCLGCVTTREARSIAREDWPRRLVAEVVQPISRKNAIDCRTDAMEALALMSGAGASRLMVMDGEMLVGMLSLKDLMRYLSLKEELEG